MKVKRNIFQKLSLLLIFIESIALFDQQFTIGLSIFFLVCSLYFEGAKPYWPLFFFIILLQYLNWSALQMVLILILGVLITLIKTYQIPIPGKGQFNSGYKAVKQGNLQVGIFYPTQQTGKKADWFPNSHYFKTIYQINYVDPQTRRLPFFIFSFLLSFISKFSMPAFLLTRLHIQPKYKLVIFSHGLGANMNVYSCITSWFASHGFIVVSVQHSNDKICVDHLHIHKDKHWEIRDFLYQSRRNDLDIRVKEVRNVIKQIRQNKFLQKHLGQQIQIEEIHLAGQSFGACTALQTLSDLIQDSQDHYIKSVIALDPWLFPLGKQVYSTIHDKKILQVNSQTFIQSTPYIYQLQKRYSQLQSSNKSSLTAVMITKMNHMDQSDMSFVFGNLMDFFRKDSHYYFYQEIVQLNLLFIGMFLEGHTKEQLIQAGNLFCKERKLDQLGFQVKEEWRRERDDMLQCQRENKEKVKMLMQKLSWWDRMLC